MENLATRDIRTEEMLLNMGPQHPGTHGVFRVVIRTDGEMILESESHVGYLHRCFEKCAEGNNYIQVVPYTDRMDYLCAIGNNLGYSQAVEKLMGLQVPERAEYIRVIVMELNRIASHLIAFGTYGLDLGAITDRPRVIVRLPLGSLERRCTTEVVETLEALRRNELGHGTTARAAESTVLVTRFQAIVRPGGHWLVAMKAALHDLTPPYAMRRP